MKEGFKLLWLWIGGVVAVGIIGVSLLLLTKDWVADLLLAKSYHSAVALMPAIAVGSALHALGTVVGQPLLADKRTRLFLLGRICGAIAAVISIPLMVKYYGLMGAAMANPIYYGVELLVLALLAKPWRAVRSAPKDAIEASSCSATA
jgi:O-antigen/teichoic acid export membrane protein